MTKHKILLTTAAAILLPALSACSDDNDETVAVNTVDETVDTIAAVPEITLTPEQQALRDAMDTEAYEAEVNTYMEEDAKAMEPGATDTAMKDAPEKSDSAAKSETKSSGENATSNSAMKNEVKPLPAASEITFSFVDRNADGKLNVAEYAIYAVRANPLKKKPNDQRKPYVSPEQLNNAADTFFFFDTDNDTYLNETEFAAAKRSSMVPE